jgi:hypothetical protein
MNLSVTILFYSATAARRAAAGRRRGGPMNSSRGLLSSEQTALPVSEGRPIRDSSVGLCRSAASSNPMACTAFHTLSGVVLRLISMWHLGGSTVRELTIREMRENLGRLGDLVDCWKGRARLSSRAGEYPSPACCQ